jgi:hypothetical protein
VIFTLEFDVESFHIGNEESSEDLIQFFDRNFLESILKKASNILDGLRLLINIVSLKVGPVLNDLSKMKEPFTAEQVKKMKDKELATLS